MTRPGRFILLAVAVLGFIAVFVAAVSPQPADSAEESQIGAVLGVWLLLLLGVIWLLDLAAQLLVTIWRGFANRSAKPS